MVTKKKGKLMPNSKDETKESTGGKRGKELHIRLKKTIAAHSQRSAARPDRTNGSIQAVDLLLD